MTRFFDLDEANETLPEVRDILESLRDQRAELIRLRDEVVERTAETDRGGEQAQAGGEGPTAADTSTATDADLRVLRLRMQGVIDRMQAEKKTHLSPEERSEILAFLQGNMGTP